MKTALHWSRGLPMAALALFTCTALARPLLVPPQRLAVPPAGNPPYQGYLEPMYTSVAIDGGTLLVTAHRPLNDENERVDGVYVFERNAEDRWAYTGVLTEEWPGAVMLNGNLATTSSYPGGIKIFERGAAGWAVTGTIPIELGHVFRIEDGSIYVRQEQISIPSCSPPYQQFRKVNSVWTQVATIGGERCDSTVGDVNDGRAIIVRWPYEGAAQPPAEIFAPTGGSAWASIASIPSPPPTNGSRNWFGPWGTIRGDTAYIDRGYIYRNSSGTWVPAGRLVEPEVEIFPSSFESRLRGNFLFLRGEEQDYELNSQDWEVTLEWRVLRVYRQTPSGFVYHARLNADYDVWGWAVSEDGRQVAAYGANHNNSTYNEPLACMSSSSGNYELSGHAAGGVQRRQFLALDGDGGAVRGGALGRDARPAAVEPGGRRRRASDGHGLDRSGHRSRHAAAGIRGCWAVVRPGHASHGRAQLLLRDLPFTRPHFDPPDARRHLHRARIHKCARQLSAGHNYRMRFESVGDQHVVFIEGFPMLQVKDDTLSRGHPGIAGYRTRFDVDNVVVSGGTRPAASRRRLRASDGFSTAGGAWGPGALEQGFPTTCSNPTRGRARWLSKIATGYQVVSTRVRPRSHGTANDPWVGLAAHVSTSPTTTM